MTTTLMRFSQAYATMTIAAYEPIIYTRWVSLVRLKQVADIAAQRMQLGQLKDLPVYHAMSMSALEGREAAARGAPAVDPAELKERLRVAGVERVPLEGFPDAVAHHGRIFPRGIAIDAPGLRDVGAAALGDALRGGPAKVDIGPVGDKPGGEGRAAASGPMPIAFNRMSASSGLGAAQWREVRKYLFSNLHEQARKAIAAGKPFEGAMLDEVFKLPNKLWVPGLWFGAVEEVLSPIGIAHYYRQLYYNIEEGVGPIEEALTVAPLETLEVLYESTRRQIHEEQIELGSETVSETAVEQKNLDEVSDKVSSMIQRDAGASMSVEGGASVGVYNFSASASANMAVSSQRSKEESSRRMKEVTTKASERITKSFTVRTKSTTETSDRALTRRVIRNDSAAPVSYGLRRVLRRVRVKLQSLGPKLVWQLYVRDPGAGLRRSKFVHFREAEEIAVPEIPPGVSPRPKGGTDTGTTSAVIQYSNSRNSYFVEIVVNPGPDRVVKALSIDSISDLEGGGKDDYAPSPANGIQWDQSTTGNTFRVKIAVLPGDGASVSIGYTYTWDPAASVLAAWEAERAAAVAALTAEKLQAKFEQDRALLTLQSKIRPRPANDLRREERYEIMNRMVSRLFASATGTNPPTPLEVESFHRYFDIEAMFVTTHPSWWRPRYTPNGTFNQEPYSITAESEPAPLGSSLGWMLQLDGDARRNEFLNSPWARICVPIRPNTERAALDWLSRHLEGAVGYDPASEPLRGLLATIATIRQRQGQVGGDGPDWVRADSPVENPAAPADPLRPEGSFPVVHEFDVTVPTDGFVYEELRIDGA